MSDRVVVWVLLDANGSVVTSSLYGEHLEAPAERWEASRIIRCVESSGASPDREATGVDLMKAWYGDDTTWGIIKEFERDRWRRLADRVSLLGAAPREDASETDRPKIVCLCGSTRFPAEFMAAQFAETIAGAIVLSVGCFPRKPDGSWDRMMVTEEQKVALDALHLRKIDLADEVFVVNVGGYIGESTSREIAYAKASGKPVLCLEPVGATEPAKEPEGAAEQSAGCEQETGAKDSQAHRPSGTLAGGDIGEPRPSLAPAPPFNESVARAEGDGVSDQPNSSTWAYVLAFAHEMERKLAANRHKGDRDGWVKMPHGWLLTRVLAETAELASALDAEDGSARITSEAADVANFAMMIADVSGGLSLLGATPREDARAARDLDIYRRTLVDLHAMCGKTGPPNTHGLDYTTVLGYRIGQMVAACERAIIALAANGAPNCEAVKECRDALASLRATEPAKEPDGERLAWVLATPLDDEPTLVRWNAYEHRRGVFVRWATPEETPGQSGTGASPESAGDMSGRGEGSQAKNDARSVSSPAAAPPVMDEPTMPIMGTDRRVPFSDLSEFAAQRIHGQSLARLAERGGVSVRELELIRSLAPVMDEAATEREVMPNAGTALPQGSANYGVHAVTGAAHPTNTPEAAREAPELCQVLPAGYVVTLNDGNGLNYRMGAPGRVVSYHATRWEAESAAFEAYGRAAWAHGDADAALLAEAHKELSRLHGNLNHTVSLADGCGCRSGRVLAKLDARLGERP